MIIFEPMLVLSPIPASIKQQLPTSSPDWVIWFAHQSTASKMIILAIVLIVGLVIPAQILLKVFPQKT